MQRRRHSTARQHGPRRRTAGQRKDLREAIQLTLISGAFVAGGIWALVTGSYVLGLVCVLFFSAGLIFGITLWVGAVRPRREPRRRRSGRSDRAFGIIGFLAAALMGLACCGIFLAALAGGDADLFSARYPRPFMLVVGGIGTLFFGGGSLVLLVQALMSSMRRARRDE